MSCLINARVVKVDARPMREHLRIVVLQKVVANLHRAGGVALKNTMDDSECHR